VLATIATLMFERGKGIYKYTPVTFESRNELALLLIEYLASVQI
jgi:hypothetical protein